MKREGLIYHWEWQLVSGEVVVAVSQKAKIAYHALRSLASGLIVAGIAGLFFTFQPIVASEVAYRMYSSFGEQKEEISDAQIAVRAIEDETQKAREFAKELGLENSHFSIYIPKIRAKAPIIENVDPVNEKSYMSALEDGVAHAAGSVFPGMNGATYLFAHSSDLGVRGVQFNTVFYLLRELKEGDEIYVFFLDKLYKYRMVSLHTVEANDTSWLTKAKEGNERLILQTCWPPGSAWKRLIIIAEPIK